MRYWSLSATQKTSVRAVSEVSHVTQVEEIMTKSEVKIILNMFFNMNGIVYSLFLPDGEVTNQRV